MGLLLFVLFGLVVGFLARAILPGRQSMGLIMTSILGMVGSLLGGFVCARIARRFTLFHGRCGCCSLRRCSLVLLLFSASSAS